MADEIKITSEVELQDGVKEGTETENKKVGKSKTKEKVAETLKKVGKTDDAAGEVDEEEEVEEKDIDLFSETAMYNAYSICHNVQDFMYFRGYRWQGMVKKKKKKKKKSLPR